MEEREPMTRSDFFKLITIHVSGAYTSLSFIYFLFSLFILEELLEWLPITSFLSLFVMTIILYNESKKTKNDS